MKFKGKEGITLIALVVTIIIMLILVAVTLNLVFKENGIIERAAEAKFMTTFKSVEEKVDLYKVGKEIDKMQNPTLYDSVIKLLPVGDKINDSEKNNFKDSLKNDIKGVSKKENLSNVNLYYIDKEKAKISEKHNYIIDVDSLQIYDLEGEKYGGQMHHYILRNNTNMGNNSDNGSEGDTGDAGDGDKETVTWTQIGTIVKGSNGQELQVGDVVNYDCKKEAKIETIQSDVEDNGRFDQTYSLSEFTGKWYVLGAENGNLLLVSDQINSNNDGGKFYIYGKLGVQNFEKELNKICELYGQSSYVSKARSIKVEDINRVTGHDPNYPGKNIYTNQEASFSGKKYNYDSAGEYGNVVTLKWDGKNNTPYYSSSNGINGNIDLSSSEPGYKSEFDLFVNGVWEKIPYSETEKEIGTITMGADSYYFTTLSDSSAYETVGIDDSSNSSKCLQGQYFLANACARGEGMSLSGIGWGYLYVSFARVCEDNCVAKMNGYEDYKYNYVRAVVELNSNVKLTGDGETGYNIS